MKPIPKELQPYTARAADPARPWWLRGAHSPDLPREWWRHGEACFFADIDDDGRAVVDKVDPLPPPPILVGQVWAAPLSGWRWCVSVVTGVVHESDGTLTIACANDRTETGSWLLTQGFLLVCPFGYAPWSGPEVL